MAALVVAVGASAAHAGTCPKLDDALRSKLAKASGTPLDNVGGPRCVATKSGYWLFVDYYDTAMGSHHIGAYDGSNKEVASSDEPDSERDMRGTSLVSLVAGDLDGDGVDEVVASLWSAPKGDPPIRQVFLYRQTGSGIVATKVETVADPCEVTVALKDKQIIVTIPASGKCPATTSKFAMTAKGVKKL
jgi:hypothetical protein